MNKFQESYGILVEDLEPFPIFKEYLDPRWKSTFAEKAERVCTGDITINEHTVKNNRVFVDNGGTRALIVVGESWTYGDSMYPYVNSTLGIDNVRYRVKKTFAGLLATAFKKPDLFLFATPGCSDVTILKELITCLSYVRKKGTYKHVSVVIQFTDPTRSNHYDFPEFFKCIKKYFCIDSEFKWEFETYFQEYEKDILDLTSDILQHFKVPGKDSLIWKNFCEFENNVENYPFKTVLTPCWRYLCELSGEAPVLPKSPNPEFYHNIKNYPILLDLEEILVREINLLETGFDALGQSLFNNWHMNELGHAIWASKLYDTLKK